MEALSYRPRNAGHDYYGRGTYLITLVVSGRERLLSHFATENGRKEEASGKGENGRIEEASGKGENGRKEEASGKGENGRKEEASGKGESGTGGVATDARPFAGSWQQGGGSCLCMHA